MHMFLQGQPDDHGCMLSAAELDSVITALAHSQREGLGNFWVPRYALAMDFCCVCRQWLSLSLATLMYALTYSSCL